jgi:predicted Zn-dependent protease
VSEEAKVKQAQFVQQLATRNLYAWFEIPRNADDDTIRAAAEAMRQKLKSTPMTQAKRATERMFCDQGEKALLLPHIRRQYDNFLEGERTVKPKALPTDKAIAERDARLEKARERVQHYDKDDIVMAAGSVSMLALPTAQAELEQERDTALDVRGEDALDLARQARVEGAHMRALALAEHAHLMAPSAGTLRTLAAAKRDVGDLAESEALLRQSVDELPGLIENVPGWIALAATLLAEGKLDEADAIGEKVVQDDEEDPYGWRILALVAAARPDHLRAGEAWERTARLGLDVPGALMGLQELRKDCLARKDQVGVMDAEARIARLRPRDDVKGAPRSAH